MNNYGMGKSEFDLNVMVRTTTGAKLALDRVVADLRASQRLRFRGKRITQEAVIGALWLWLESLDRSVLEDGLAEALPKLEAMIAHTPEDPGYTVGRPIAHKKPKNVASGSDSNDPPRTNRKSS